MGLDGLVLMMGMPDDESADSVEREDVAVDIEVDLTTAL